MEQKVFNDDINPNHIRVERPEWKWGYLIPFSMGRKNYKKDRARYDNQFLTKSGEIRAKQETAINGVSIMLIMLITTLWTALPTAIPDWQPIQNGWLSWMKLGMEDVSWKTNWGGAIWLLIVPGLAGTVVHKAPNLIPQRKVRFFVNAGVKIIPVLLLIISYYLIYTEKKFWKLRAYEKLPEKEMINIVNDIKKNQL